MPIQIINEIQNRSSARERYVIAIAGPPGAGKSTVALEFAQKLENAKILQMDGFHYDNAVLDELGLRNRKGSPETFDYPGFAAVLRRVHAREPNIVVPVFDRTLDLARAGASLIHQDIKFILVEGNYLLLDEAPWKGLETYFDLTIFLDVPKPELEKRLLERWLEHGRTQQEAEHWVSSNDMPNVDRVLNSRRQEDLLLSNFAEDL